MTLITPSSMRGGAPSAARCAGMTRVDLIWVEGKIEH